MKGYKIRFILTALSICLCLTACGTATADDNSTAASADIQSGISTEQSADVSAEQSADVSVEASEEVSADVSEEVSAEPMESTDISEDIDISEESAPTEELSEEPIEDESSVAPPAGTTEPEQDISKPAEDPSEPAEDPSEPAEDPSEPTEDPSEPVEDPSEPTEDVSKVETPAPHTHSYSLNFYNPAPTCTKDGYNLYKCSCGDSYKEVLPATGHDFSEWKSRSGSTYFTYHDVNNGYAVITLEEAMKDIRHLLRYCNRCRYGEVMDKEGCITPADAEWICNRIIELLNEERAKLGAPALSTAPIAHEMAMVRAQELTVVFSHNRPNGENGDTVFIDYNYNPERSGECWVWYKGERVLYTGPDIGSENICGGGASKDDTKEDFAREIVQEFKESPGHWKDLTNPNYTGVGVGVCFVDEGASSWFYDCPVAILTMDKTYG